MAPKFFFSLNVIAFDVNEKLFLALFVAENLRVFICGTKEEEDPYINATYVHVSILSSRKKNALKIERTSELLKKLRNFRS